MKKMRTMAMAALVTAFGLAAPGAAEAQEAVPPMQQEQQIEVTDELLERFAAVYPEVLRIAQGAQNELATVETAEEAQAIQADAQSRVAEILDEGEVTPVEYEAVVVKLNDDPAMMAKFEAMLAEEREDSGGL